EVAAVFATNEPDRAEVDRFADGSVEVRLYRIAPVLAGPDGNGNGRLRADQYFVRRYLPAETHEIRLHMMDGADNVVIRGGARESMLVRAIGGKGADVLVDSSVVTDDDDATI